MFYVGLDVSVARTAVCIMDAAGKVVREQSMASTLGRSRRRSGHSGGRSSGSALRLASTPPGSRRRDGRVDPSPDRGSSDADGVRASQLQHAVEDMDSDAHLGRLASVGVRAQAVADHLLEARHTCLGLARLV